MAEGSPLQTDFPIKIGTADFTLTYPIEAIWAFEDATKFDIMSNGITEEQLLSMSVRARMEWIIDLLWAGLITRHPEFDSAELRKDGRARRAKLTSVLYFRDIQAVEGRVVEAFKASLPGLDVAVRPEDDSPLAATSQPN